MSLADEVILFIKTSKELKELSKNISILLINTPSTHAGLVLSAGKSDDTKKPESIIASIDTSVKKIPINQNYFSTHIKKPGFAFIKAATKTSSPWALYDSLYESKNFSKNQYTTGPSKLLLKSASVREIDSATYVRFLQKYFYKFKLTEDQLSNEKVISLLIGLAICDSFLIKTKLVLEQDLIENTKTLIVSPSEKNALEIIANASFSALTDKEKYFVNDLLNLEKKISTSIGSFDIKALDLENIDKTLQVFVDGVMFAINNL